MDMDLEQKAIMRLREAADTSERFYKAPLIRHALLSVLCSRQMQGACRRRETL